MALEVMKAIRKAELDGDDIRKKAHESARNMISEANKEAYLSVEHAVSNANDEAKEALLNVPNEVCDDIKEISDKTKAECALIRENASKNMETAIKKVIDYITA